MSFPKPPFKLNDEGKGDQVLLKYLKEADNFSFLSPEAIEKINQLEIGEEENMLKVRDDLFELWPIVLTDALRELKRNDPREWEDPADEKTATFFDSTSLGVAELKDVFAGFSDFEGMMYGASPEKYRDHVVHSFRVWIIGQGLLKNCLGGKVAVDAKLAREISKGEWECMWALVALCHDIGYPLSQIERVNEQARDALLKQGLLPQGDLRFTFSQQMQPFHDALIRLMASKPVKLAEVVRPPKNEEKEEKERIYVTHLQNKYYMKLLKSFDNLDHGVVSSLLISKALVYFLESDLCHDWWSPLTGEDARQFLIRREILRAIASHTCQEIYHLKFDTLSFLLYMADEIQCWGRPTLIKMQTEPTEIMEGHAHVEKFGSKEVDVRIATDDEQWDEKEVRDWIGRLRKMLRLAVGTQKLKESRLHFEGRNKKGDRCTLDLKDGKLLGPVLED